MTSKPVAFLLADLGVTKSHSRPHVTNDNPYSREPVQTLKYRPEFPDRFGCYRGRARRSAAGSSPGTTTSTATPASACTPPPTSTTARAERSKPQRADVLAAAYATHPERFVRKPPRPPALPDRRVDQPAEGGPRYDTVIPQGICLRKVDTRRSGGR